MDSVEERLALEELFVHILRGIKGLDDYIKSTSQYFNVPLNSTDLKHSLLLWQEHVEINKEISQKRKLLAEIVDEGSEIVKKGHPESANVQEYIDSKRSDLNNLEHACEEQMQQLEVSIMSFLEKKHCSRKLEGDKSESCSGEDQIPISVKDVQASELTVKLRGTLEKSWETYQPLALLEIEKSLLKPSSLHAAVLCGTYDKVERLCKIKEEIVQRDFLGRSALHGAISCTITHEETNIAMSILNLLLNSGLDPWEKDETMGLNSFEYAARIKAYPALNLLLSKVGEDRSNIKVDFEGLVPASLAGDYVNILKCCSADTINKNAGEFILEVCEKGSAKVLNYMIENFDVIDRLNQVDEYENTLLHKACARQQFTVLELLLRCGLRVDATNVIEKTPLHVASEVRAIKCIEVLLRHGSDVLAKDKEGRTPLYLGRHHADILDLLTASSSNQLYLAVHSGNVEYIRNLIDGDKNENVLHIAAELGNDELIELFADKVADLNARDDTGLTALHLALGGGHVKCAEILINKGANVGCEDKMCNKPLHLAARCGYHSILKLLLTKGAKIDCTDINDQSALHLACRYSNFDCVATLLENGAYVNSQDRWGNYPLHLAAKTGDGKVLDLLCEKGADVDVENLRKRTALHRASEQGNAAWVEGLLKRRVNVNSRDEHSNTPLILAAKYDRCDVLKLLIKNNASMNVTNEKFETAMRLACENNCLECVKELESNGYARDSSDIPIIFYVAASKGHKGIIAHLISKGWNINKVHDGKVSALYIAAGLGHVESVQTLIENGADVHIGDNNGLKPFLVAALLNKCNIMKLLLRNGVNVNCTDNLNHTALHLAATSPHSGQTVRFLIENGADINSQDISGHTPMHVAFFEDNKEVIDILKQHGARMDIRNRKGLRPSEMMRIFFGGHRLFINQFFQRT